MAKILVVGSGGREHAICAKLEESPSVEHIYVVPGNAGTATIGAKVSNVGSVNPDAFSELLDFAVKEKVSLVVPGPEVPLINGIKDYFRINGPASISVFGPSQAAAQLEGSKAFAKDFMKRHGIPTATYETFNDYTEAQAWLDCNKDTRVVIKASGIAAGKGVLLPSSHEEATTALRQIMVEKEFGSSGDEVVIETWLDGDELSVLSFSDGFSVQSLPAAQDHKRIRDNDQGPNTGGMGCYAPAPLATPVLMERIHREIIQPTIDGMRKERMPFVGCLFTGFMITKDGPFLLEYNVRQGDPETQTLLPLLDSSLFEIMDACTLGYLSSVDVKIKPGFSTTVVASAAGYPMSYKKGDIITLNKPPADTYIFHAGTAIEAKSNRLITAGGRVIASTAIGTTLVSAVEKAYTGIKSIEFAGMHYRTDIAHRALKRTVMDTNCAATAPRKPLTYAEAGVSITAGNELVQNIKPYVKSTAQAWAGAEIGGFAGGIDLAAAGYSTSSPRIIACIDGIGTKILIAQAVGDYSTIGIDLVAMNVNDLIVAGAKPLAFLDYYACSELNVKEATSFIQGVAAGCREGLSALVGGETAELNNIYRPGDWDAAGCAIGALGQENPLLPVKEMMVAGDVLLGLGSDGCHSNGFSLIRRIIQRSGLAYSDPAPWDPATTVGRSLLTPTRIYVQSLLPVLYDATTGAPRVKGMAHITGGGITENVPRMLPKHLSADLDVSTWPVPPVLAYLKAEGALTHDEWARTFNTGLGMVLVVGQDEASRIVEELKGAGEKVYRAGQLVERKNHDGCILNGLEAWDKL